MTLVPTPNSKAKVQKSKTWLHHWHMSGMQRPEAPLTVATNGSTKMLEHQLTAQRILHDYRDETFLPIQSATDFAQAIAGAHHMWSLVANDSDDKGLMEHSNQTPLLAPPW